MIELARHIEVLLLDNECILVPGLGGFVTHYIPAARTAGENLFFPPTRIIGFNPRLTMNDGLLAQSYASVHGATFPDAAKMVERDVKALKETLHEEGRAELPNIGELRCSVHGTYDFIPYDNRITTPCLYGLGSFEMQELSGLKNSEDKKRAIPLPHAVTARRRNMPRRKIRLRQSHVFNAVAVAMAVILFSLSAPVENTEVMEESHARFLPEELFERIKKQSVVSTPVAVGQNTPQRNRKTQVPGNVRKTVKPVAVKEIKVKGVEKERPASGSAAVRTEETSRQASAANARRYHIIIASVGAEKDAQAMARQLKQKGFDDAQAIIGDGRMRVSISSYSSEEDAYKALNNIRKDETYRNAWVLKK